MFHQKINKMKQTLYTACLLVLLFAGSSFSQDYKGSVFLGGNLNVSGNVNSDEFYKAERFGFSVTPNIGGFVSRSFALGGTVSYRWSRQMNSNNFDDGSLSETANTIGASVYARYYKFFGSKFAFITTGSVGYLYGFSNIERKNIDRLFTSKGEQNSVSASLTPGIVYFISPKFGLEASFGSIGYVYYHNKQTATEEGFGSETSRNESSSFQVDFDITSLQIGLMYYFGGKKQE